MPTVGQWGPEEFLDRRGRPVPGVTVYVYETDGVTLASVYTSQTGATALANPLPIGVPTTAAGVDVRGNGTFYAEPGPYILGVSYGGAEVYRASITVSTDDDSGIPGGDGAPTTVDYLVGTAQPGLSGEIVVGTTPGGELGGTWASPTVDATHSGSSHAGIQAAAQGFATARDLVLTTALGEPTGVDPVTPTTMAFMYGAVTSTVTITPSGPSFDIWLAGTKYTLVGPQVVNITTADGTWYVYYQADGWHASQTPWSVDSATAQVALVYIDKTTAAAGMLADERHGIAMDWATHARLHTVDGSQVSAGATMSGAVVNTTTFAASNPGVADTQFALASTTFRDEDIALTLPPLAAAGPYHLVRKIGTGTRWTWTTAAWPFWTVGDDYTAGAAYITYNQLVGGTTWQQTALTTGQYVNYYVFAANFVSPASARFIIVPGQAVYATLALAQAESVLGLALSDFPSAEFAPLYQFTLQASSNNNYNDVPGRVRLTANPVRLIGYKASVASAVAPSSHTALSNRTVADSHPAEAISFAAAGFIATDVEAALIELRAMLP